MAENGSKRSADWVKWGAVWGFIGVAAGTFGAHGLDQVAQAEKAAEWWETAVLYHLVHALALVLSGVLQRQDSSANGPRRAGACFVLGSAIFSGTLYAMALGAPRWLGAVTPIGGLLMLAGWALLARR